MSGLRGVVVGAGYFGRHWMGILGQRKDCRLAGVVAADRESLEGALAGWRGERVPGAHLRLDVALETERPDFAIVAVPELAHREVVCRLIEAGVHTLCEKPLAMTRKDADAMMAAHRSHPGVTVMIDQNFRWRPSVQTLREQIGKGVIGDVGEVAIVHRQKITRGTVGAWRETMAQPYLFDMAVHLFDLVRYLTGREAESVYARMYRPGWSWYEGAPALCAEIALTGGVHGQVSGTFLAIGFETAQEGMITLAGSSGTLLYGEDRKLTLFRDGAREEIPLVPMKDVDCAYTLAHFLECVRSGSRPETDLTDNLKTFSMVLAALESDAKGERVPVPRI